MTALTTPRPAAVGARSSRRAGVAAGIRIAVMDLRLLLREPSVLVGLVAFPAVTVLILAGVFGSEPDPEFAGIRPSEHYVVGYVGVVLAQLGLVTLPVHLATHRELGVARRYRAAGISAGATIASQGLLGAVLALAAGVTVLMVGAAVYGLPMPQDPLAVAGWSLAGVACFVALGMALGTLAPSSRAAAALGNLVFVPMFLLGGGGPPREVMTGPMRVLSDALPLSHVIGGLRHAWLGPTDDPRSLWWTVLVTGVAVALAVRTARRRVA
jgi:ABC-2 type transport system permease protein